MFRFTSVSFVILLGTIVAIHAATHYVAPPSAGNDAATGTADAPWATLQHAVDNVKAGDSLIVRAGTYKGFAMGADAPANGTKTSRIVIAAQPGAIINDRNSSTADGINLEGTSYITIEGFTIKNVKGTITRAGIRAVIDTGVIIRGNSADSCGTWGIFTGFSENILIENNIASRSVQQHGIYFSNSADNPVIRGNTSYGNSGCGIHMNGDESMGGDGIIAHALVERNIIYNNGKTGGSGINCDGVQHSRIQNNLLYGNHASGISLFQGDGAEPATDDTVVNNTILEAANARWCLNIKGGSTGTLASNNILYNYHSSHGSISVDQASMTGLKSDYNIVMDRLSPDDDNTVMTLAQWRSSTGSDSHSLTANPEQLFVNASSNDFRCKAGSPAIDAGTRQFAPVIDLAGTSRPTGNEFDIGAYEFSSNAVHTPYPGLTQVRWSAKSNGQAIIRQVDLNGRVIRGNFSSAVILAGIRKVMYVR